MAREIDRIPIDEVETAKDHYKGERCGVCGHTWEGHPPGALWRIMPIGFIARHFEPRFYRDEDCLFPCHRFETFAQIGARGIELSSCAYLRPVGPVETNLVILVNRTGENKTVGMKRTPDEVCPPMHKRSETAIKRAKAFFRKMMIGTAPGRNGHHGNG
jgi:hypothetical protein